MNAGMPDAGEGAQMRSLPAPPSAATLVRGLMGLGPHAGGVLVVLQF